MKRFLRIALTVGLVFLALGVWAGGSKEKAAGAKPVEKMGKFTIVLHQVHRNVMTKGAGGDVTADWLAKHPEVEGIEWVTLGIADIHSKIFREASLDKTPVDIGFVMNEYFSPEVANLFEPLDGFISKDPPEEWGDVFDSLKEMVKIKGVSYSMPFRTTVTGLHYNAEMFKSRGLPEPKQGMFFEDLLAVAGSLRYKAGDGTDVFPYLIPGDDVGNVVDISRAWNGEFIDANFKCRINEPGMIKAVTLLRDLYAKDLYPKAFSSITNNDLNTWVQQGRIAMTSQATGKNVVFNSKDSKVTGQIKTISFPISKEFASQYKVAPVKSSLWSLSVPKNARNKELSWSFIKHVVGKNNTLGAAINGNGPIRKSTYADETYRKANSAFWEAELASLAVARPTNPAFANAQQAKDIFLNYVTQAIIGRLEVQDAMNKAKAEIDKLLP
jgi:multiple sugar transport system substrate-binding protein